MPMSKITYFKIHTKPFSYHLQGSAQAADDLPSFLWDENEVSSSGVPLLKVYFPDGSIDEADLKKVSSEACIFNGYLRKEPSSFVVLSKGCPFTYTFEIQFYSSHLPNGFAYNVKGGVTSKIVPPFQRSGITDRQLVHKDYIQKINKAMERVAFPPNGFDLNIKFFYDQLFKAKFGASVDTTIDSILNFVQGFYKLPSLTTTISFIKKPNQELPGSLTDEASEATL